MSSNEHKHSIHNIPIPESIDPWYKNIPMDLNSSPLQDYFEQQHMFGSIDAAAVTPPERTAKAVPVIIPPSSISAHSEQKKKHHKRSRKPVAHTFPDESLEAVMDRRMQPPQFTSSSSSQPFIVGSLQEKPPVPWPSTLTTPDLKRRHRLTNRQTVNWPILLEQSRRYRSSDEEDDIFDMENDDYSYHRIDPYADDDDIASL